MISDAKKHNHHPSRNRESGSDNHQAVIPYPEAMPGKGLGKAGI